MSLGILAGSFWKPRLTHASVDDTSRVIVVTDDLVAEGSAINMEVVRIMLDRGLMELTETASIQDAWFYLFPDLALDYQMGIKINAANPLLPSHLEVVYPLAYSLAETAVAGGMYPLNNVLAWDRTDMELIAAGHAINTSTSGVRCFGTMHTGIGFSNIAVAVNGTTQYVSRCYTDYSDGLINLSCLKHHWIPGLTTSLKNHYGTISSAYLTHDNNCDPWLPSLNRALLDEFGQKERLHICDGIFGLITGGPLGSPQIAPKCLIFSEDPVALEAISREILEEYGWTDRALSHYIETAAGEPYSLGNADLADIERIDIVNPSLGVSKTETGMPAGIRLGKNYPEPFNAQTTIPLSLDRTAAIDLAIFNTAGQRIVTLYRGSLTSGKHEFSWNADRTADRSVSSGRYIVRLQVDDRQHSRMMTLLR